MEHLKDLIPILQSPILQRQEQRLLIHIQEILRQVTPVTPVFTALIEDAASGQTVPATAKASTSIVNGRYSLYTEQAGNGHPLELTVSSPKEFY